VDAGMMVLHPAAASGAAPRAVPDRTVSSAPAESFTPREREVLALVAEGLANKMIARKLGITEHTVKFHLNAILTKLGAQSRTEAVVKATRMGLLAL
jgi:DNA-binding NarL/FixJ family response regulator